MMLVLIFHINDIAGLSKIISESGYRFKVFYGSYYKLSDYSLLGLELYRLQGLSEEAGTFALALLPAYYYFLLNDSKIKLSIVLCALIFTLSAAAAVAFAVSIILLSVKRAYKHAIIVTGSLALFLFIFNINTINNSLISVPSPLSEAEVLVEAVPVHKETIVQRSTSFFVRVQELGFYINHLQSLSWTQILFGNGAGFPFTADYATTVSNGWLVKFLEAGIVGGILYATFFIMLCLAPFILISTFGFDKLTLVYYLSLVSLVIISSTRQPAEASFWQWIVYAGFFRLISHINLIDQKIKCRHFSKNNLTVIN